MSGRIDWRNYDYSEGPPRVTLPKKAPREPQHTNLSRVAVAVSTLQSTYTPAPARIVSNEVTPKSTNDLTNYEDELLAKVTSKQDGDRTLTYRPSHSTSTPRGKSTSAVVATSIGGTSPTDSSHDSPSQSPPSTFDANDSIHKLSSSIRAQASTNVKVHTPVIQPAISQSPILQKNLGEIPYDSVSFPLDEDPIPSDDDSAAAGSVAAPNSTLEDPPLLHRQTVVPEDVPPLDDDQPVPSSPDKYAYTSFGDGVFGCNQEDWDNDPNEDDKHVEYDANAEYDGNVEYYENVEYDIQSYEEDVASLHQDRAQDPDTKQHSAVTQEEEEIMMWNQARDEWNQMFQAIQQSYQSGNSATHRTAATAKSSSSSSTIVRDASRQEHAPTNGPQDHNAVPVVTTKAPTTNVKTTTNPSTREVAKPSSIDPSMNHGPYPDIDSQIEDDEEEEDERLLEVSKLSKLDVYNDATEKRHPKTTFDVNASFDTQLVNNSPHVNKDSYRECKSLMLDDEYDDVDSEDYDSSKKYNRFSSVHEKAMRPSSSTHNQSKPSMNRVGFHTDDRNQVHEYIQEEEEPSVVTYEYDDEGTYQSETTRSLTQDSLAGRSLNSLYSKSALSEVEDFFSDILLLGSGDYRNPGRRPVKYKSNRRSEVDYLEEHQYQKERDRILRDQKRTGAMINGDDDEISTDADESMTLTTVDDERTRDTSTFDRTVNESSYDDLTFDDLKDEEGTFLDTVDETDQDEASSHLERYRKRHGGKRSYDEEENDEPSSLSVLWGFFENSISVINQAIDSAVSNSSDSESKLTESDIERKTSRRVKNLDSNTLKRENFMRLALDSVFRRKTMMARASHCRQFDESDMEETLTEISLSAARARHAAKNLTYDETATLDITKHIQIFSVILPLPLGLLFEESSHCCWVSRIFERGNAALLTKGKVLLGDHIVAVNETSVVFYKVADVCKVLSLVEDPSCVELTFIRYSGPIRHSSANMEHEGYEVVDPILSRSQQVKVEQPMAALPATAPTTAVASKNPRASNMPQKTKPGGASNSDSKLKTDGTNNNTNKFRLFKMFKRR